MIMTVTMVKLEFIYCTLWRALPAVSTFCVDKGNQGILQYNPKILIKEVVK